ncbi:MAG TPA: hypothetical protein DCE47_08710, partial [Planctomycetaceae bacterium]|nr:hypothetical protein [Planctomycetaceae bacterium]
MNASESSSKRYRVKTAGVIRGPFTPGRIQQLLDDGTIGPGDGACADGEDWITVAAVLGRPVGADTANGASPPALPPTPEPEATPAEDETQTAPAAGDDPGEDFEDDAMAFLMESGDVPVAPPSADTSLE